nr:translation initiation factor IF-2-like [Oryctolagus cuniculus]
MNLGVHPSLGGGALIQGKGRQRGSEHAGCPKKRGVGGETQGLGCALEKLHIRKGICDRPRGTDSIALRGQATPGRRTLPSPNASCKCQGALPPATFPEDLCTGGGPALKALPQFTSLSLRSESAPGSSGSGRWAPSPFLSADSARCSPQQKASAATASVPRLPLPYPNYGARSCATPERPGPARPDSRGAAPLLELSGRGASSLPPSRRGGGGGGGGGGGSGGRARGGAGEGPRRWRLRRRQVWTGRRYGVVHSRPLLPGSGAGPELGAAPACAQLGVRPGTLRFRAQRLEAKDARPGPQWRCGPGEGGHAWSLSGAGTRRPRLRAGGGLRPQPGAPTHPRPPAGTRREELEYT